MPLDPSTLSKTMRKLNPHLTNPVTSYTPAEEGLVMVKPKRKKITVKTDYSKLLFPFLEASGIDRPSEEVRFHVERLWRFDFAWVLGMGFDRGGVALEIEGGAFSQGGGGHNRGQHFIDDMLKYSTAASMGWLVIRRMPKDLLTMETVRLLKGAMQ